MDYWPCLKKDIKTFVAECQECQHNKYETLSPRVYCSLCPFPKKVWNDISINFIVGLPLCKGKFVIFVVVDRLTKYANFMALAHSFTALTVTQVFVENVFKLHGMPPTIVSDRDAIFLSHFWKEFFKLQGSKLYMSSGYHPQSDGQTDVVNRCLETYLRCFVGSQPKKWVDWLPWAERNYNSSYDTSSTFIHF